MEATSRELEITVLSCEDLRIGGKPVKKNTYVVVRTDPLNYRETMVDIEGGSYPSWGQKLVLNMPMHERFVTLEVQSHRKLIGLARMPVTDFMDGYLPDNYLNFLSYRLRDEQGLRNGIINVSVLVKGPEYFPTNKNKNNKVAAENKFSTKTSSQPALSVPMGEKSFGEIVTGIPIWVEKDDQLVTDF